MKAQDLRIGNLIYWDVPEKVNTPHEVVGIIKGKPQTIPISLGDSIEDYKPIPLTEERLVRFGFVVNDCGKRKYVYKQITAVCYISFQMHNDTAYLCIEPPKNDYEGDECCEQVDIKYVHQLQNFVFALTGQELETTFNK